MDTCDLRLLLVDVNPAICDAWAQAFAGLPDVQIICGRFEDVPEWDAIVAPGNSFGIMDGGLDLAIKEFYDRRGQDYSELKTQRIIHGLYGGELPVGSAIIVDMLKPGPHRYLIYAPTMRIPMSIVGTENVYLAMKAALHAAGRLPDEIKTLLVPALGMGTGCVPYDEGARQMALAYRYWLNPPQRMDWAMAVERHRTIAGVR